jgi:hypothetical protein
VAYALKIHHNYVKVADRKLTNHFVNCASSPSRLMIGFNTE